jgi:hypothetical protein
VSLSGGPRLSRDRHILSPKRISAPCLAPDYSPTLRPSLNAPIRRSSNRVALRFRAKRILCVAARAQCNTIVWRNADYLLRAAKCFAVSYESRREAYRIVSGILPVTPSPLLLPVAIVRRPRVPSISSDTAAVDVIAGVDERSAATGRPTSSRPQSYVGDRLRCLVSRSGTGGGNSSARVGPSILTTAAVFLFNPTPPDLRSPALPSPLSVCDASPLGVASKRMGPTARCGRAWSFRGPEIQNGDERKVPYLAA